MSAPKKMRFAIMLNGLECQQWQADAVAHLLSDSRIDLELLIIKESQASIQKKTLSRWWDKYLLLKIYRKFFMKLKVAQASYPDWIRSTPQLFCNPNEKGYSQIFNDEDVSRIKSHRLDFILRFGFNILRGDILNSATYGIWSFHHGDEQKFRGGPPGFWEIMKNEHVTGAILQKLTPKLDAGVILKKGYFKSIQHSWPESFSQLLEHTAIWPLQVATDLLNGHLDLSILSPAQTNAPVYRFPKNITMLRFFIRMIINRIKLYWQDMFMPEHWNVGIIDAPIEHVLRSEKLPIQWLPDLPTHRFRADPFGFKHNGEHFLVVEDYEYSSSLGTLQAVDTLGKEFPFFEKSDLHYSYPFTFTYNGETYCLPECFQSGLLDLFVWESELRQFKKVKTLMENVAIADPTLVEIDGAWWLFCTHRNMSNTLLYIYHATSPFGPFEAHQNNPVKCDIQSARPAGNIFNFEGKWYRPAQDCAATYGHRIVIHEILALTPTHFTERKVKTIEPQAPYQQGMHTLSKFGDKTLVDGKVFRFNWPNFRNQLKRKLFKKA